MVTNGEAEAIFMVLCALLDVGDKVLLCEPVFPPYENGIKMTMAKFVKVPMCAKHRYLPQFSDIICCITPDSKTFVLVN